MKIKEIGKTVTGKTPSTKDEHNFNGNILFVTPSDITKGSYIDNTVRTISEQGFKSIKTNTISGYSVLVGCIGSDMGNVAWTDKTCATNQQINSITEINSDINPLYIYYYLSTKKELLKQLAGTTTTPILPKSVFEEIDIPVPEKHIQDKIVDVLKSIDGKISTNNRINSELESMAKTIYDYWFTQFDFPDENGKPYKSSGGKMVWNDELKMEIPEGWRVGTLSDISDITMGSSPKGESLNEEKEGIIFYQGKTDFGNRFPTERVYTTAPIRYAEKGDVLLSVRAPVGSINIANEKCCIGRGLAAIHSLYSSFIFYTMLANQYHFDKFNQAGTTFGAATKDDVFNMLVIIPDDIVISGFESKISSMDKMIFTNYVENQQLAALRDWLLPMLMNGQVGFKEVE